MAAFSFHFWHTHTTPKPGTILLQMNAKPGWLSLLRTVHCRFFENGVIPDFLKAGKAVQAQFYDSEYLNAPVSAYRNHKF